MRRDRKGDGWFAKLLNPLRDASTYRDLLYVWIIQPVLGLINFLVAVTVWAIPLWALTLPIYAVRWQEAAPEVWPGERLDTWSEVIPVAIAGLVVLPLVPWIIRGFARLDAAAARWLLSPMKREELEDQIDTLRETQARSVDIAMADRRQIAGSAPNLAGRPARLPSPMAGNCAPRQQAVLPCPERR